MPIGYLRIVFAALLCATATEAAALQKPEVASAVRLLEAWIESQMAYRNQPGLSIAVVHDQQVVWMKGFGQADLEKKAPATPQTIYRVASNTKLFTAMAVMQLRDEGKLGLDDPVARHLPWFKPKQAPGSPAVTIRQLLTHTSGLPREAAAPYWNDFKFPTRDQVREGLPAQEAVYEPETRWKYSNLALTIAGEIVASVSGEPYADFVNRRILMPLGMSSTSLHLPAGHKPRLATGYGRRMPDGRREVMPWSELDGISAAASMSSTVEDFARFASMQFREAPPVGSQVISARTLKEMHRLHWLQPDWKMGWGIGFQVWRDGDRTLVGHGGSLAGYRSQTAISLEDKIAVIVMTNCDDGNPAMFVQQAFRYLAPAIAAAVTPAAKPTPPPVVWSRYAGRYRNLWGDSQVLIYNDQLTMIDPTSQDPKETMSTLVPLSDGTVRLENKNGFAAVGERVIFETGPDGEVTRMRVGEVYSRRLAAAQP